MEKEAQEGNLQNFGIAFPYYSTVEAFMNAYTRWVLALKLKNEQFCFGFNPDGVLLLYQDIKEI